MALLDLQQGNVDVGFFQDTNITQGIHTRYGSGYAVWEIDKIAGIGGGGSQCPGERKLGVR